MITDSPLWINPYYANKYTATSFITDAVKGHIEFHESKLGVRWINFWLSPIEHFDTRGRFQKAEESRKDHEGLLDFLTKNGLAFCHLPPSHDQRLSLAVAHLKELGFLREDERL